MVLFLKHAQTLTVVPDSLQDLQEAFNILDALQWSEADLQDYTANQETIDRERRQQEGSYEEGVKTEKIAVVINLLKNNIDIGIIAQSTGLSIQQIEVFKKNLKV